VVSPVALFFVAFTLPSCILAFLALRDFLARGLEPGVAKVRRAMRLQALAGALPLGMVLLTIALTAGAPLATQGGWVFIGYGLVAGALGPAGALLFRKAAQDPRRRLIRAAETAPLLLVMLNLVLVVNAAVQIP
jgi:hypothetical protein